MIDLEWIVSKVEADDYIFSRHADEERMNDSLMISEVEESMFNGSILESYPEDKRGSSCLVVGFTKQGKPIHTVCGKSGDRLVIITVYIPTPPKFITPYERRK
ncbi:MAG: DUF4258 domain-containing protein [Epsilonproteobacteria bacterium]|nr:DUF4258 domain-containing protein [Campylobacterota bacterium]